MDQARFWDISHLPPFWPKKYPTQPQSINIVDCFSSALHVNFEVYQLCLHSKFYSVNCPPFWFNYQSVCAGTYKDHCSLRKVQVTKIPGWPHQGKVLTRSTVLSHFSYFFSALSSCSGGRIVSPSEKQNILKKLLWVHTGREPNVAAHSDVNMENGFFWLDLRQINENNSTQDWFRTWILLMHGNGCTRDGCRTYW